MKKKATIKERHLHTQILSGDDLALSKLYTLYGQPVIISLKSWYSQVAKKDEALILEAVNEAFWGYYNNPSNFHPDQNTLKRFLEMAAERDLINILEKEKKHSGKKEIPEDVELEEKFWNSIVGNTESTDAELIREEVLDKADKELAKHFKKPLDASLAKLVLQKERKNWSVCKGTGYRWITFGRTKRQGKEAQRSNQKSLGKK